MIITLGDRIADEMIVGFTVAASSGVFAALASVLSKVALEDGGILIRAAVCPWISDEYCDRASIQNSCSLDWSKIDYTLGLFMR